MHAKALMDSALWSPELVATVSHGEIGDGFRWERAIRRGDPAQDGLAESEFQSEVTLAVIAVSVRWTDGGDEKEYTIGTMRVVPDYGDQQQ